jgi:glyoxylase-like metal-dependent hydrolase (beta-lactamase superfamily II)
MLRLHADDVFGWSRFQPERGYDFNGTALVAGETVLLVDPIAATPAEFEAIRKLGRRFEIVLLNADHERDAAHFAKSLDAPIHVARADLTGVRTAGALPVDDGQKLPGGWIFRTFANLKTPGESVLLHPGKRLCIVGDAIIADPVTGLRLVPPIKIGDRAAALGSLGQLAALDFDGMICGDGFSLPSGGREALRRFLAREQPKP